MSKRVSESDELGLQAKKLKKEAKKAKKAAKNEVAESNESSGDASLDDRKATKKKAKKSKKDSAEAVDPNESSASAGVAGGVVSVAGEKFSSREELTVRIEQLQESGRHRLSSSSSKPKKSKKKGLRGGDLDLATALCALHPSLKAKDVKGVYYGRHERFPDDECFVATVAKGEGGEDDEVPVGFKKVLDALFGKQSKEDKQRSKDRAAAAARAVATTSSNGGDGGAAVAAESKPATSKATSKTNKAASCDSKQSGAGFETFASTPFHPGLKKLLSDAFPGKAPTPIQVRN
jgi:hypothetical protein